MLQCSPAVNTDGGFLSKSLNFDTYTDWNHATGHFQSALDLANVDIMLDELQSILLSDSLMTSTNIYSTSETSSGAAPAASDTVDDASLGLCLDDYWLASGVDATATNDVMLDWRLAMTSASNPTMPQVPFVDVAPARQFVAPADMDDSDPFGVYDIRQQLSPASTATDLSSTDSYQDVMPECRGDLLDGDRRSLKGSVHLWQFLKELLSCPVDYQHAIRWVDRDSGVFKIENSSVVAKLWGKRKNRPHMNYDKLSRSLRQYYRKGILCKTQNSRRLVYQFYPQYL